MTSTIEHDYVIVLKINTKRGQRWGVEDNRATVKGDDGKPLTFPTRDDAAQWIKEQEGKQL